MIRIDNKEGCSGCHGCATVCPKGCITMLRDDEGFLYPHVNEQSCVDCGLCEQVCPILHPLSKNEPPQALAVMNKDDTVRFESSSGGVFTLLAEAVIDRGGVVFGAAFDERFAVRHIPVKTKEDLSRLRGSKYLQSTIGDTYRQAQALLQAGTPVLFTGTPCQIEGLYGYLRQEYDHLITADIICHGVPSPAVWDEYIRYREGDAASPVETVSFRYKKDGWKGFLLRLVFKNGREHKQPRSADVYMQGFLKNLSLRPSCYACSFKSFERAADITLADFWGVANVHPDMDDDKGTSLVFVHSKKGQALIQDLLSDCVSCPTDAKKAGERNHAMIRSVMRPEGRDTFIRDVLAHGFDFAKKKYFKTTYKDVIKSLRRKLTMLKKGKMRR
ncbi:MAG: Coenzyme F420 hydrogenase/dehydrogenase, beta subunit C-terminal domain [Clostridia bacterium]|nr:Coenzyme F420 hydrogenase/dehydrogenase, beta subunit C-terminal domain [Clostridia bacterium]